MLDRFDRDISYLRVSVIDRCNFRCSYCKGAHDFIMKEHEDILSYEDIRDIVQTGAELGITKVRLTGGEPLVRKNLEILVKYIADIEGIREIAMTTNASLLKEKAQVLKDAGLDRLNISLDSLNPETFKELTQRDDLADVLEGIDASIEAGFANTKINMVVIPEKNIDEIPEMEVFCEEKGFNLQLIKLFSLYEKKIPETDHGYDRPPPCSECNKIRLLADGMIKPCLFTDKEVKMDMNDIKGSLLHAVALKPKQGDTCSTRAMNQIGG